MRISLSGVITFFLISGCSTTLRPDLSVPATAADYPTAEFYAGGKQFHGLGQISIVKGRPLSAAEIEVQGYLTGIVRADSEACGLNESWTYTGSERLKIVLPGSAVTSCLVDILVSPTYPEKMNSGAERTYEFKGQLFIKVIDPNARWQGYSTKLRSDTDEQVAVDAGRPSGKARLLFRGCDSTFDRELPIEDGLVKSSFKDVVPPGTSTAHCLLEGFIRGTEQGATPTRVSWNVWRYPKEFLPLPLPSIKSPKFGEVVVEGDPSVSVISLDGVYKVNYKAEFKFDPATAHTMRLFTVKGRSVLCEYSPETLEGWTCSN